MKSFFTPALITLAALALLAGCGGGGSGGSHAALSASAKTPEGLTATVSQDKASVAAGGAVTYTLTLTNNTPARIIYKTRTVCGIDAQRVGGAVLVTGADGATTYPFDTCAAIGVSGRTTLEPGQSVSETFSPPDAFTARGTHAATVTFSTEGVDAPDYAFGVTQVGPVTVEVQ